MDKMLKFYVKVFYVMCKALSGELSCTQTSLVTCFLYLLVNWWYLILFTYSYVWQINCKGRVSIRGFSWYLNMSIIFWEQIATYRGHASPKTLNQLEL